MNRYSFTGISNNKRFVFCLVLSGVSMLLWLVPMLIGQRTPFDWLIVLVWIVCILFMLTNMRRNDSKNTALLHTAYFDEHSKQGFSPYIGTFDCSSVHEFLNKLIVLFSSPDLMNGAKTVVTAPEEFVPSLILETASFRYTKDETQSTSSVLCAEDVTIDEWSGKIIYARSGYNRRFFSKYELDQAF